MTSDRFVRDLKSHLNGRFVIPGESANGLRQALWNGDAPRHTKALIRCMTPDDVQLAVKIAGSHGLPVSALGGGHDWVGRAICESGLTLDMRALTGTRVDRDASSITLGGGALVKHALAALQNDQAFVSGVHTQVGIAGLALGGGYGKLNYRYGLALDCLLGADVVLGDGSYARVDLDQHADLFWALRGAGKNFGILTSLTFRLFPIPKVLNGVFFIPLNLAGTGLSRVQEMLHEASDSLSIFCSLTRVPELGFGLLAELLWDGQDAAGETYADRLASLNGTVVVKREWVSYRDIFDASGDTLWPVGEGYEMDSHNLPALTASVIDTIVELARQSPSDQNCIMLHDFHGAASTVPESSTAFALRQDHFNMQVVGRWDAEDSGAKQSAHEWLVAVRDAMRPHTLRGGYPAVLGPDSHDKAQLFYGSARARLQQIKIKYDPDNRYSADYGVV